MHNQLKTLHGEEFQAQTPTEGMAFAKLPANVREDRLASPLTWKYEMEKHANCYAHEAHNLNMLFNKISNELLTITHSNFIFLINGYLNSAMVCLYKPLE